MNTCHMSHIPFSHSFLFSTHTRTHLQAHLIFFCSFSFARLDIAAFHQFSFQFEFSVRFLYIFIHSFQHRFDSGFWSLVADLIFSINKECTSWMPLLQKKNFFFGFSSLSSFPIFFFSFSIILCCHLFSTYNFQFVMYTRLLLFPLHLVCVFLFCRALNANMVCYGLYVLCAVCHLHSNTYSTVKPVNSGIKFPPLSSSI